jgi:hypothetical protein
MQMKRLALAITASMALLTALAAPAEAAKFQAFLACNPSSKSPDAGCVIGDLPGAIFRALKREHVRYQVCIRTPSGGKSCASKRTRDKGERSSVAIKLGSVGTYSATWTVRGKVVARASMKVRPENA